MPRTGWKSVSLRDVLLEEIDQIMKEKPGFWNSKADVITYALRRLIEMSKKNEVQITVNLNIIDKLEYLAKADLLITMVNDARDKQVK